MKTKSQAEKERLIAEALTELKIHLLIEKEILYPAVRKRVGSLWVRVAGFVPVCIVDSLEMVEVSHHHAEPEIVPGCSIE